MAHMRSTLRRTVAPAAVLSYPEVKDHCNVDHDDDEAYIVGLIHAATAYMDGPDGVLGLALCTQTYELDVDGLPENLMLPIAPVQSWSATYYDADNVSQALGAGTYRLHSGLSGAYLKQDATQSVPSVYSRDDAATFTLVCGYGEPSSVPKDLVQAMLMLIGHWYANRESVAVGTITGTVPMAFDAIVARYKRVIW